MTGIVLALAGLTAGDGGAGMGAARAPVRVSLVGEWGGSLLGLLGNGVPYSALYDSERGWLRLEGTRYNIRLTAVGNRHVLVIGTKTTLRTCRWRGTEVRIQIEDYRLLVLRPAPRKP